MPEFEREHRAALSLFELRRSDLHRQYIARLWTAPEDPAAGERGRQAACGTTTPLMVIDFICGPTFIAYFVPFFDLRILRWSAAAPPQDCALLTALSALRAC